MGITFGQNGYNIWQILWFLCDLCTFFEKVMRRVIFRVSKSFQNKTHRSHRMLYPLPKFIQMRMIRKNYVAYSETTTTKGKSCLEFRSPRLSKRSCWIEKTSPTWPFSPVPSTFWRLTERWTSSLMSIRTRRTTAHTSSFRATFGSSPSHPFGVNSKGSLCKNLQGLSLFRKIYCALYEKTHFWKDSKWTKLSTPLLDSPWTMSEGSSILSFNWNYYTGSCLARFGSWRHIGVTT